MSDDEKNALAFLMGRLHPVDPNAFPRSLVKILRSGHLSDDLRQALANAIEPQGSSSRQLVLRHRSKGNPGNPIATAVRDARLGRAVFDSLEEADQQVESAVHKVMEKSGLSRSTVMHAWEQWKQHRRDIEGKSS